MRYWRKSKLLIGHRTPQAASAKSSEKEDRPKVRDLLATVNSASEGAAATWLAFLGTMAYLAVTLGGVTHVDLLLNNDTTLPFVNVKVPLATFFVMAPLAFVLVHFSLLLQHVMLSRKLDAFEECLTKEQPSRDRGTQNIRDELHSFTFTQVASGKPKSAVVDMAQRLVISLTLVVFPLLLLTFFQIGFLAYHSEPITWWHRGMLIADATVIVILTRHLTKRNRPTKVKLTDWWHARSALRESFTIWWCRKLSVAWWTLSRAKLRVRGHDYGPMIARIVRPLLKALRAVSTFGIRFGAHILSPNRFTIGLLVLFSFCVAILPDSPDSRWDPLDRWMRSITRFSEPVPFCRPTKRVTIDSSGKRKKEWTLCPEVTAITRRAFYPTAYIFEHEVNVTTGKSNSPLGWSRNLIVTDKNLVEDDKKEARLNLRGRDLRYATLDRSDLRRTDFYRANLGRARLVETNLVAANFYATRLQGADLREARLQGADLREAGLQGADLREAGLQGADLREAGLQGADLSGAGLQGVDFSEAGLQGATLRQVGLQGADLSGAGLQGADLSGAELQGADLSRARLWITSLPGDRGGPTSNDVWYLVSFAQIRIHPLTEDEREALSKAIANLKELPEISVKKGTIGIGSLLGANVDDKWKQDLQTWCKLARQPPPNPAALSSYLGKFACQDATDKGYMAQRLIERVLESEPNAFFETFKGCPAFGRTSAYFKSWLERASQLDRESKEQTKQVLDRAHLACRTTSFTIARQQIVRGLRANSRVFLKAFSRCPTFARAPDDLKPWLLLLAARQRRWEIIEQHRAAQSASTEVPSVCPPPQDAGQPNPPSSAPR